MERVKNRNAKFGYTGLAVITFVFALIAVILFVERSGIQYRYNQLSLELLPQEHIVTKEAALAQSPKTALILWDSKDAASQDAWAEFEVMMEDMRVGYDLIDAASETQYTFAPYKTVIVLLNDLSMLGDQIIPLCDWVYDGGGAMFPMTLQKETYFTMVQTKLGISESSYDNAVVDSIYVDEDFMLGGGQRYEITDPWNSALAVQLMDSDSVTVHAYTGDSRELPLIWENRYGKGKFVLDNFGLYEKSTRGFYAASYSLLGEVGFYPVINGSVFYLDDFPSQVPRGDSNYVQRDYGMSIRDFYVNVWWLDMMNYADQYGIKFTGLAIECYDDKVDGTVNAFPDKVTFLNFGNMLLRQCGEIGYHGYNHQPLCLSNCDYKGLYEYKTWESEYAMKKALDELMRFCDELFPDVWMSVYVPPSNLLSDEGKALLLREYPHIKTVSGIYFADDELDFSCTQEFEVFESGVVDQPRIISGCYIEPFMQLAALSELNYHFINSHFTHPDDALDPDRGAELGWEKLKEYFGEYLSWLYSSAPVLRNMTGTEMSAAVQRYAALTIAQELTEEEMTLTLGNFYDEAQIMLRFNDRKPGTVTGGKLEQLTDTLYLLVADSANVTVRFS